MKKRVAILVFDDVEGLDFAGPFEVFAVADELTDHQTFTVFTIAETPSTVRTCHGLKIVPDFTCENCPPVDVLVIPGGSGTRPLLRHSALIEWVRRQAQTAEIVMSVCTGSLVLAEAGLLDGLFATTHHELIDLLRDTAPRAHVVAHERFTDNGKICTSGGISAGLDLSLHVVERLLGKDAAQKTASYLEYPPHAR